MYPTVGAAVPILTADSGAPPDVNADPCPVPYGMFQWEGVLPEGKCTRGAIQGWMARAFAASYSSKSAGECIECLPGGGVEGVAGALRPEAVVYIWQAPYFAQSVFPTPLF